MSDETRTIVTYLINQGLNNTEISKKTCKSRYLVPNIRKKLSNNQNLGHKLSGGRSRATTEIEDRQQVRLSKRDITQNSRNLANQWSQGLNKNLSPRTVRRRLCEYRLRSFVQKLKPFCNVRQRKKRLEWCRWHRSWSVNQ